jgi:hypothetical protein
VERKSVRVVSCMILEGSKNIFAFCCLSSSFTNSFINRFISTSFYCLFGACGERSRLPLKSFQCIAEPHHHNLMGKDIEGKSAPERIHAVVYFYLSLVQNRSFCKFYQNIVSNIPQIQ